MRATGLAVPGAELDLDAAEVRREVDGIVRPPPCVLEDRWTEHFVGRRRVGHAVTVRWDDLRRQAPRLAAVAHERLIAPGVLHVVTIRRDGTPRLSPVEPLVLDGELWLSMMWQSRKASDLLRDDRILVHSITTTREGNEGEVKVRGRAIPVDDPGVRDRYRDEVAILGWQPEEPNFHLFRVDLTDVTVIRYGSAGDQYVARWPSGAEFVRRATSPTSVGAEEPIVDLLQPE